MNRRSFLYKSTGIVLFSGAIAIGLNAQSRDKNTKYTVIAQRCDGCGHCYRSCHKQALLPKDGKAAIDINKCEGCGDCTRFCRRMAIVEKKG
jgi:MinD superfamily P-loop ATPase